MKKVSVFLLFILLFTFCLSPIKSSALSVTKPSFEPEAEGIYMINTDTGTVIYEKNAQKRLYPASLTKLMTAILVMENVKDMDKETVTAEPKHFNEFVGETVSNADIKMGETLTVRQLLDCVLIQSANEAANMLAEYVGNGKENFVKMMNERAVQLGCKDTHFVNPHGMHDDNHYTTPYDMYLITKHAKTLPGFNEIVSQPRMTVAATNKHAERLLLNTNLMMDAIRGGPQYYYKPVTGVKTGSTEKAGYCLISTASQDGYNYLCVMMHAPMKDKNGKTRTDRPDLADTKKLYQWAFSSFKLQPGADVKEPVAQIKVKCSFGKDKVNLLPEKELSVLLPSEVNASSIIKTPNIPKELTAPVKKGQVVGTATLTLANEKIGEINLIAEETIERSDLLFVLDAIGRFFSSGVFKVLLILLVLCVILYIVYVILLNRRRKRYKKVKRYRRL